MSQDTVADRRIVLPHSQPDPLRGTSFFLWTFRLCVVGLLGVAFYCGGPFIKAAAVAALVGSLIGDGVGLVRQTLYGVGLLVGLLLAMWQSVPIARLVESHVGLSGTLAAIIVGSLIVSLAVVFTGFFGRRLSRGLRRYRYPFVLNRVLGNLAGVGIGVVILIAHVWVLALFGTTISAARLSLSGSDSTTGAGTVPSMHGPVAFVNQSRSTMVAALARLDRMHGAIVDDPAGRWVVRQNPLPKVPQVRAVVASAELAADTKVFWQAVDDGVFDEMLMDPVIAKRYQAFRNDGRMEKAIEQRDLQALLTSHHYVSALNDQAFCEAVAGYWPEIERQLPKDKIAQARRHMDELDATSRARVERGLDRARGLGIEVP